MDIIRGSESNWSPLDADDELPEENVYSCKMPGRGHVNSLLNISEENSAKEFLYKIHVQPGWEEAVHGWGTCSPLACLFQFPKYKMAEPGGNEFHCILCIDLKLSENCKTDHSADSGSVEISCRLAEDHEAKGTTFPTLHLNRLSDCPSEVSHLNSGQCKFKDKSAALNHDEFCHKMAEEAKLNIPPETLPRVAYINLAIQCPLMKERGIIDNFTVLPPVKGSSVPWSTDSMKRSGVTSDLTRANSGVVKTGSWGISAGERCAEGEEITPDTHTDSEISEDSCRSLTKYCKYYQAQPSKLLLSPFSIGIPKRCDLLLNCFTDTEAQAAYLIGRKLKNDNPSRLIIKSKQDHSLKHREPQLPVLLGTRVPLLAASHRIMYPSM